MENLDEKRYLAAQKKVQDIKGFYGNLTSYIIVNLGFLVLNLLTSPEHLWFFWPMFGWGIGVVFHGMRVFGQDVFLGRNWEEKKIKEFMDKDKNNNLNNLRNEK